MGLLLTACSVASTPQVLVVQVTTSPWPTYTPYPPLVPFPTYTPYPTYTPWVVTATPLFTVTITNTPTIIPIRETYILTLGWCLLSVTADSGDPGKISLCSMETREQIKLDSLEEYTVRVDSYIPSYMVTELEGYCALYSLDGIYIMSDIDTIGRGEVACSPKLGEMK